MPKVQVNPIRWTPPTDPGLVGPYEVNDVLDAAEVWPVPGEAPEDVVVDENATVYTGLVDGSIWALSDGGAKLRRVANTEGRPLGIELYEDGTLLVCDAYRGLLTVDRETGEITTLVGEVDGRPLKLTNNASVGDDGTIWFTDSSQRFDLEEYKGDLIEHSGTGRLLRRDPDGSVTVVLTGLYFPNGVALSPDQRTLYIAETAMFRILTVDVSEERPTPHTFAVVPGFPDNLSMGPSGTLWCAVASPRNTALDAVANKPGFLAKAMWNLPEALKPSPAAVALVFGFAENGEVTHNLQRHGAGEFTVATGVREHNGDLYLGSLHARCIIRHRLT